MKIQTRFAAVLITSIFGIAPLSSRSAEPDISTPGKINGFLGIRWGTSMAAVKATVSAREGVEFHKEKTGVTGAQVFRGGTIAGHKVDHMVLSFFNDGFYEAYVQFEVNVFDDLLAQLKKKYHDPTTRSSTSCTWLFAFEEIVLLQEMKDGMPLYTTMSYVETSVRRKTYQAHPTSPSPTMTDL